MFDNWRNPCSHFLVRTEITFLLTNEGYVVDTAWILVTPLFFEREDASRNLSVLAFSGLFRHTVSAYKNPDFDLGAIFL